MYFILTANKNCSVAHFAFYVSDIEKMKLFYCENFSGHAGNRYHNPTKKFTSYFIQFQSGSRLEIMQQEGRMLNENSNWHISFSVGKKSKVDELVQSLQNRNVPVIAEPRYTGDGYYEGIISDPEGNLVEITI